LGHNALRHAPRDPATDYAADSRSDSAGAKNFPSASPLSHNGRRNTRILSLVGAKRGPGGLSRALRTTLYQGRETAESPPQDPVDCKSRLRPVSTQYPEIIGRWDRCSALGGECQRQTHGLAQVRRGGFPSTERLRSPFEFTFWLRVIFCMQKCSFCKKSLQK
jgi:hypothetical protein